MTFKLLADLEETPYPIGPVSGELAWGNATNQGRYADPVILTYRLTGEQRFLDAASALADYALGLNPAGKSYVTGLGADPPNNPTHLDSFYTEQAGKGPVPGLVIFGPRTNPSGASYEQVVWSRVHPAWSTLPVQRRYAEGWSLIGVQEFATVDPMALNVCMHAFLSPAK